MTRVRAAALGVCLTLGGPGCAGFSRSSNTSANSANSSGQSGNSSGQSGATSQYSNTSSQQSSGSSNQSSANSRNSQTSVESTGATTNATSDAPSSSLVAGSALLLGVAGGIFTTVYTVHRRREARLQREQLKALQQPQPMPYKVEPIPLTAPPPPPPMPPAEPPKPPRSGLTDEPPTLDAMVMARAWLLANELQLREDLALGAGPTIDDLAGIAGIAPEHRGHFGQVLQRNRQRLLITPEVTPEQAAEVMSRVGDLVMADPILRVDGGAALASN